MKKQAMRNCLNKLFTNGDIWMANKHMKIILKSSAIRIIPVKNIMRYHYTRKAKILKIVTTPNAGQGCKKH